MDSSGDLVEDGEMMKKSGRHIFGTLGMVDAEEDPFAGKGGEEPGGEEEEEEEEAVEEIAVPEDEDGEGAFSDAGSNIPSEEDRRHDSSLEMSDGNLESPIGGGEQGEGDGGGDGKGGGADAGKEVAAEKQEASSRIVVDEDELEREARAIFESADVDGRGRVTRSALRKVLEAQGFSNDDIQAMLSSSNSSSNNNNNKSMGSSGGILTALTDGLRKYEAEIKAREAGVYTSEKHAMEQKQQQGGQLGSVGQKVEGQGSAAHASNQNHGDGGGDDDAKQNRRESGAAAVAPKGPMGSASAAKSASPAKDRSRGSRGEAGGGKTSKGTGWSRGSGGRGSRDASLRSSDLGGSLAKSRGVSQILEGGDASVHLLEARTEISRLEREVERLRGGDGPKMIIKAQEDVQKAREALEAAQGELVHLTAAARMIRTFPPIHDGTNFGPLSVGSRPAPPLPLVLSSSTSPSPSHPRPSSSSSKAQQGHNSFLTLSLNGLIATQGRGPLRIGGAAGRPAVKAYGGSRSSGAKGTPTRGAGGVTRGPDVRGGSMESRQVASAGSVLRSKSVTSEGGGGGGKRGREGGGGGTSAPPGRRGERRSKSASGDGRRSKVKGLKASGTRGGISNGHNNDDDDEDDEQQEEEEEEEIVWGERQGIGVGGGRESSMERKEASQLAIDMASLVERAALGDTSALPLFMPLPDETHVSLIECGLASVLSQLVVEQRTHSLVRAQALRLITCLCLNRTGLEETLREQELTGYLDGVALMSSDMGESAGWGAEWQVAQDAARLSFVLRGGVDRLGMGGAGTWRGEMVDEEGGGEGGHVLISYADKDKDVAHALSRILKREGLSVWLRGERYAYGLEVDASRAGVKGAGCVVVLASAAYQHSAACRLESRMCQVIGTPIVVMPLHTGAMPGGGWLVMLGRSAEAVAPTIGRGGRDLKSSVDSLVRSVIALDLPMRKPPPSLKMRGRGGGSRKPKKSKVSSSKPTVETAMGGSNRPGSASSVMRPSSVLSTSGFLHVQAEQGDESRDSAHQKGANGSFLTTTQRFRNAATVIPDGDDARPQGRRSAEEIGRRIQLSNNSGSIQGGGGVGVGVVTAAPLREMLDPSLWVHGDPPRPLVLRGPRARGIARPASASNQGSIKGIKGEEEQGSASMMGIKGGGGQGLASVYFHDFQHRNSGGLAAHDDKMISSSNHKDHNSHSSSRPASASAMSIDHRQPQSSSLGRQQQRGAAGRSVRPASASSISKVQQPPASTTASRLGVGVTANNKENRDKNKNSNNRPASASSSSIRLDHKIADATPQGAMRPASASLSRVEAGSMRASSKRAPEIAPPSQVTGILQEQQQIRVAVPRLNLLRTGGGTGHAGEAPLSAVSKDTRMTSFSSFSNYRE